MGELTIARPSRGGGGTPAGVIVMWSGAADAIPEGWALCDGTNGTPDLRGRFVLGAGGSYAAGATGGEASHQLTVSEMPRHSHQYTVSSFKSTGNFPLCVNSPSGENLKTFDTASVGGNASHNNMPPYYALCFIMRL